VTDTAANQRKETKSKVVMKENKQQQEQVKPATGAC
jgi:hypothetical protein